MMLALGLIGSLSGCADGAGSSPDLAGARTLEEVGNGLDASSTEAHSPAQQHVISTAEVELEAKHPDTAADEVTQAVAKLGGRVESRSVYRASDDSPASASLTVRVPPKQLDAAIATFSQIGELRSQSSSAQDVTTEYVDLEARVKALETSVKRLNDLMAGAATTSELIEAESALTQRQQELDGLRAQFKALDTEVSEATIWVSITAPHVLPGGGPTGFWDGLKAGLSSLVAAGAGALVVLGILIPWLAVAGVIALAIIMMVRFARLSRERKRPRGLGVGDQHRSVAAQASPGKEGA